MKSVNWKYRIFNFLTIACYAGVRLSRVKTITIAQQYFFIAKSTTCPTFVLICLQSHNLRHKQQSAVQALKSKDFKEQQQHCLSDSTPRAGSGRLKRRQKVCKST